MRENDLIEVPKSFLSRQQPTTAMLTPLARKSFAERALKELKKIPGCDGLWATNAELGRSLLGKLPEGSLTQSLRLEQFDW